MNVIFAQNNVQDEIKNVYTTCFVMYSDVLCIHGSDKERQILDKHIVGGHAKKRALIRKWLKSPFPDVDSWISVGQGHKMEEITAETTEKLTYSTTYKRLVQLHNIKPRFFQNSAVFLTACF